MARDGIADVTYVNPGYQPGRFPIIAAGELPFLFATPRGARWRSTPGTANMRETEMKDIKFCFAFIHDPGAFHSRTKKIVVPDDLKGMKIRPAQSTIGEMVTMLGGTNVQASAPEVARHHRARRRRRDHLPVGLDVAVRHRQGDEVSHRRAALRRRRSPS